MDFKEILAKNKPMIWKEVQKYLVKYGLFDYANIVNDYSIRQGKYGRGTLVLMMCKAFDGDVEKAVKTAAAMQFSEDWLLIHDDFEDNSDQRRGKPAHHKIYGNEISVNAGDAVHVIMWKVLIDNRDILDEKTTFRVMKEFLRFLEITAMGQHTEMSIIQKKSLEDVDYKDYEDIIATKAGEYTIAGPLRLGAIIAGQPASILDKITEFSIPLGKAFQIRDDILNIVGEGSVYGKEIGGDIFEGKRTVLLIHLIKNTVGEEHRKVLEIMNKPREKKSVNEVEYILNLMKKTGSVKFAEKMAESFADEAKIKFKKYFAKLSNKEEFEAAIDFFALKRKV